MSNRRWLEAKEIVISATVSNHRFSVLKLVEPLSNRHFFEVQMYGKSLPYDEEHYLPQLFNTSIQAVTEGMNWIEEAENYSEYPELKSQPIQGLYHVDL